MQDQDSRTEPRTQDAVAMISHVRLTQVAQVLRGLVVHYDTTGREAMADDLRELLTDGAHVDGVPAPLHTPPGVRDKELAEEMSRSVHARYDSAYLLAIHHLGTDPYHSAAADNHTG